MRFHILMDGNIPSSQVPQPIGPCRPLCEEVRKTAEPLLRHYGFEWPADLNCTRFPAENNQEAMCMLPKPPRDTGADAVRNDNVALGQPPAATLPEWGRHRVSAGVLVHSMVLAMC